MVNLANKLVEKHDIRLEIFCLEDGLAYHLDSRVQHTPFRTRYRSKMHKLMSLIPDGFRMAKLLKRSGDEVVLSFQFRSNVINVLAKLFGARHRAIVSERVYANDFYRDQWYSFVAFFLIRFFYNRADAVTCNAEDIKTGLIEIGVRTPIHVITNGYDHDQIRAKAEDVLPTGLVNFDGVRRSILSIGRLSVQKGHTYLLNAIAKTSNPDKYRVLIIGEGSLANKLDKEIQRLGLREIVKVIPFQKNPYAFIKACDYVAMPSLYEGYPNVVCESLLIGKPVLAFDFKSGCAELITAENGVRVPLFDVEELAARIDQFTPDSFNINTSMINSTEQLFTRYERVLQGND